MGQLANTKYQLRDVIYKAYSSSYSIDFGLLTTVIVNDYFAMDDKLALMLASDAVIASLSSSCFSTNSLLMVWF